MKPTSMQSLNEHFFATVSQPTIGCWLWPGSVTLEGYGRLQFHRQTFVAHRVAYELTHGPIPRGILVCHHCDTPRCVRPDHLFLGTTAQNLSDMTTKGRSAAGVRNGRAKLTEADVLAMRQRYAEGGITQQRLGYLYHITQTVVSGILRGKQWQHTDGPLSTPAPHRSKPRLSIEAVREIRHLHQDEGMTVDVLAVRFGLHRSGIFDILAKRRYAHIE